MIQFVQAAPIDIQGCVEIKDYLLCCGRGDEVVVVAAEGCAVGDYVAEDGDGGAREGGVVGVEDF